MKLQISELRNHRVRKGEERTMCVCMRFTNARILIRVC